MNNAPDPLPPQARRHRTLIIIAAVILAGLPLFLAGLRMAGYL